MANTTVNCEVIVFITGISMEVVNLDISENTPVNIFITHIKRSTRFKF